VEKDTRRLALASVAAGIATVTLIPVQAGWGLPRHGSLAAAFAFGYNSFSWFDAVQNVVLFLPLGYLIAAGHRGAARSPWRAGAAGLAFSAAIECAQCALPGRFASIWDIAFNALGAALGAWIAGRVGRFATADGDSARDAAQSASG
jgi:hypothetical protein